MRYNYDVVTPVSRGSIERGKNVLPSERPSKVIKDKTRNEAREKAED